jgi:hypothetical protein
MSTLAGSFRTALIAASFAGASLAAFADAPAPAGTGELWEVRSSMSMQGFAMPPHTMRVCTAKDSNEPAGANPQPDCQTSDVKVSGNTTSWRVACPGPPKLTGSGQITRGDGTYQGTMRFASPDGEMTMKLDGKRLGGACTPKK